MRVVECEQGSDEWRLARSGKVTASVIDAVVSEGRGGKPSATRARLMGRLIAETLTGSVAENGFTSKATEDGIEREPAAVACYELAQDEMAEKVGFVLHPSIERSGASPDRLIGERGLLQVKAPMCHTHIEYLLAGKVPSEYMPQMAWELACSEREWCDFVSFNPEMPPELQLFVVRYVPPAGYIATLERSVRDFLREMDAKIADLKGLRAPQDITHAISVQATPRVVTINPNIF